MAGAHKPNHDYHLVDPSPWPFLGSVGALIMAIGGIGLMRWLAEGELVMAGMNLANPWLFLIGFAVVLYTMFGWWRDTVRESKAGYHTKVVSLHLRYGMILFIASEVMFFVAWFWAFFDASLFPDEVHQVLRMEHTGGVWPPQGIEVFDPWHLPLLNTLILLLSGTTVTWAHHALLEYGHAAFAFSGNIYGATFFMATGFHGFHVLVGTIFLLVCLIRALNGHFTPQKHFGFEAAAWYWHFVDVVWLFLFAAVYIWGGWGGVIHE